MAVAVIEGHLTRAQAAQRYRVSAKIVARWVERFKAGGREAMLDRSSRPHAIARQTDQAQVQLIITLCRQHLTGQHIAMQTGLSAATVSRVLKRAGLSRFKDIEPA
jgi:transposase